MKNKDITPKTGPDKGELIVEKKHIINFNTLHNYFIYTR